MSEPVSREAHFRSVLARLPTGVVVLTGGESGSPSGLVVGSFMSVSLRPPLIAVCPAKTSTSWPKLRERGAFCANVLGSGQDDVARAFARSGGDKFAGIDWQPAPATGAPLIAGVAAWIDCRIGETIEAGDHLLVFGEVLELGVETLSGALVFHSGVLKSLL